MVLRSMLVWQVVLAEHWMFWSIFLAFLLLEVTDGLLGFEHLLLVLDLQVPHL